jgi:LPS-assembly protein
MNPCTRFAPVAFAIAFCGVVQAADDPPGIGLRLQRNSVANSAGDAALPTFIYGHRIEGTANKESTVEGDAELRKGPTSINADWMRFQHETEDVEARGSVRLERDGDVMIGPRLKYNVRQGTGVFEKPEFFLSPRPKPDRLPVAGRGKAESIELRGEDRLRITDGTFTTCKPGNDDWYVSAGQLDLDFGREVGTANAPKIYFKGVPIIQVPWLDFSLNNQRKSGLLPPTFGRSGRSGIEFSLPYYFNIAPNYDFTFTPRQMENRGTQLGGVFRYLERNYLGEARMEYLPDDKQTHVSRSAVSVQHTYASGTGFAGGLTLNKVSDDNYFRDLATRINVTSQSILLREGFLSRSGTWWDSGSYSALGRVQNFQVLQDPLSPVARPYGRLPQLLFTGNRQDFHGLDVSLTSEYVDFHHPTDVLGRRIIVNPSISLPLVTPSAYITPRIGLHATQYSLDRTAPGQPRSVSRTLPTLSVDSGLVFERDSVWRGQKFLQTLDPGIRHCRCGLQLRADFLRKFLRGWRPDK